MTLPAPHSVSQDKLRVGIPRLYGQSIGPDHFQKGSPPGAGQDYELDADNIVIHRLIEHAFHPRLQKPAIPIHVKNR